jgi:hypothetical protein
MVNAQAIPLRGARLDLRSSATVCDAFSSKAFLPMKRLFLAAAIATAAATPALASDSHYRSYCGWQQGVYVCESRYDSDYSTTSTLCGSGGYDAACTTTTKYKKPQPPKPRMPQVESSGGVTIFRGR